MMKKKILLLSTLMFLSSNTSHALPTEGTVICGEVTNVNSPSEIMKAEANSIINWWSFDIEKMKRSLLIHKIMYY